MQLRLICNLTGRNLRPRPLVEFRGRAWPGRANSYMELTTLRLAHICRQAGLPKEAVNSLMAA